MARSAIALGCAPVLPRHFRVMRRLSEYGLFRAGGVLIGTHAFLSYGNLLGLRWSETARTQDGDLAHAGKSLSLALPSSLQAVFCEEGSVAVSIPHPARYALHKLLVFAERKGSFLQKAQKDLRQAAALLEYLKAMRGWEVEEAWADLLARGRGWTTRAKQGRDALARSAPELAIKDWLRMPSGGPAKRRRS